MEKLDCHTSLKLEETVLTYLADNVGSRTTYFPTCVSLKETINKNSNDDIDLNKGNYNLEEVSVTVLEFDVTYVSLGESKDWSTKIGQRPQREVNWGSGMYRRDLETDDEEEEDMDKEGEAVVAGEDNRELRKETKAEIKAFLKNQLDGKRKKDKLSIKDVEEEMDKVLVEERMDKVLQKMNEEKQAKKKNDLIVKAGSGTNTVNKKNKDKKVLKDTNKDICTAIETALCCSQRAINYQSSTKQSNQGDIDESGQYCEDLGCNWVRMCGTGRSDDQVMAWIDEDDDDGWDDDGWDISWDDDGWRRHRDRFLQDVVEPQGQDEESIEKSQRTLQSVGKYSYEADTTVHKYPKKDCPAYSHPNANPTWYDNYDGTDSDNIRPDNTRGKNRGYAYTYTCPAYGILNDKDFNEAIRCLTPLDPQATYAQLDLYNIENAAFCSINRYSLQEQKLPMITCEESDEYGCGKTDFRGDFESGKNDDLLPPVNMVQNDGEEGEFCVDLSTYTP